ncbi:putative DNA binding domain-containing protein [Corynebacterium macginleyi]|uniref:DNA binding domain-containing protein n=1 Tax=Corynebacterium macginleyi TaxID=38290 RepID=A0ABS1Y761_9CORY|nr:ATP-binding protein [Corynebacterium macginleyi]MBK4144863.1 winged helix-turn-helix transcriptional regulator [Corynebacterium macginleyi]MBK4165113.1 winged helix-turn-helix transcriptional regulator [Corynebacterium macginleyi]MBM0244220.1 putative DNA binding domain-containing protein [Corynebacterium macginleyi]
MDLEEIEQIVHNLRAIGKDTGTVEVKAAGGGLPKKITRSVSAFANGKGGTIIFGLDEESGFLPVEGFQAESIAKALVEACAEKLTPAIRADVEIGAVDGAPVVVAEIPELAPFDKPCWVTAQSKYNGSYIREHDEDRLLKPYEIDRLEENKIQPSWDLEVVEAATIADLDRDIVQQILERERGLRPGIFGKFSDERALKALHLTGVGEDGEVHPTLAGLLVAGIYPQEFFPRLNVTFTAYAGTDKTSTKGQRFVDNASFVGPIPELVPAVVFAVEKNMRVGGVVDGPFREDLPDYPPVAVREAVANALMHRDYSPQARGTQVQVDMYADRLEIINPGGLFGMVNVNNLGDPGMTSARNQHLSQLLEVTAISGGSGYVAENRGTGYIEILDQLQKTLLPPPKPADSLTMFTLTFQRREMTLPERSASIYGGSSERIMEYLAQQQSANSRELAAAAGISVGGVRRILNQLVDSGRIERTEPLRSPKQRYRLVK